MGRLILVVYVLVMAIPVCGKEALVFSGFQLGSYVDHNSLSILDHNGTAKDGYICSRSEDLFVKMMFDPGVEKSKFLNFSIYKNRNIEPKLMCSSAEDSDIYQGNVSLFWNKSELLEHLNYLGFSLIGGDDKIAHRLSKKIWKDKTCHNVEDELEGEYSYTGKVGREFVANVVSRGDLVLSVEFSAYDRVEMLELHTKLDCYSGDK